MAANTGKMFAPIPGTPSKKGQTSKGDPWVPVTPIENIVPPKPEAHRSKGVPVGEWTYRDCEGRRLGYVWRFDVENGGKEFVYLTWCRHAVTGELVWRFKAWLPPRPLYGLEQLAAHPIAPVLICEGEKCADFARVLLRDWIIIASPGGSNAGGKADWSPLKERRVVIWPDADAPGRKYAECVASLALQEGAGSVAIVEPPEGVADGWDLADALREGWTREKVHELIAAAKSAEANDRAKNAGRAARGEGRRRRPPQRDGVLELIRDCELWCDKNGVSYITAPVNGHKENWPLKSRNTKRWLINKHRVELGTSVGSQAIDDAVRLMDAIAANQGKSYRIFRRVGFFGNKRFVDLCDDNWRVVEVTTAGWALTDDCPIKFIRSSAMRALPVPVAGGMIESLRGFVNVRGDEDFMIICAWLVAAAWGEGPYPILAISGEQGSGKSNLSRVLKAIIDPNDAPVRSAPKEDRDLVIAAHNSHVLAFDNLSGIQHWLSDALCRIATSGGYGTRALYNNTEETVIYAQRLIVLNGIPDLSSRADLADRSMSLHLPTIPQGERRAESDFWKDFDAVLPEILGAVLDAVSSALRNIDGVKLAHLPRMADFAKVIEAASPGLGWEPGQFLEVYEGNRADMADTAFDSDPVAVWLEKLVDDRGGVWEGSATALLRDAGEIAPEATRNSKYWPASAMSMGSAVRRVAPLLRQRGFEIDTRHSGSRTIRIVRVGRPG